MLMCFYLVDRCVLYTHINNYSFETAWWPTLNEAAMENMIEIHYTDVIMTTMASQTTSLTVVYSTVYSDADQRKHQSSASLAFVWGIDRDRWIPRTKGQLRGKCLHLMTSSCNHWQTQQHRNCIGNSWEIPCFMQYKHKYYTICPLSLTLIISVSNLGRVRHPRGVRGRCSVGRRGATFRWQQRDSHQGFCGYGMQWVSFIAW